MQQILSVWSSLDTRRRVVVVGATLLMFVAVIGLSRMAGTPSMSLLYAGLEPAAAGEVVAALDQQGVAFEVRDGAIFVDHARRDSLRMTLAAQGLPANGASGYELLDSLSGFGTTSQMFDAAYWRAKEGELARTIAAGGAVRAARVHISNPVSNPFRRDLRPTASVSLASGSGPIAPQQARAIKFLVASAVAGLAAEDVSVIDASGALVAAEEDGMASAGDRENALRRNVQRILEARVGAGNAVVEVNVQTVTDTEAIVERRFDPDSRVAISTETEERATSSSGTDSGAVTVASNLPEGDVSGGNSTSLSEDTETRERVNYEVSETTREVVRAAGAVKRISVAVLVDGLRAVDPATGQETWTPRGDAELDALRDLVASVLGFDADRGYSITIRSLEFQPVEIAGPAEAPGFLPVLNLDAMALVQIGVLAFVALVLGLFVLRPILARPAPPARLTRTAADPASRDRTASAGGADAEAPVLTGEIDDGPGPLPRMAVVGQGRDSGQPGALSDADPVERLRQLIDERRDETVEILRSWMEETEETA